MLAGAAAGLALALVLGALSLAADKSPGTRAPAANWGLQAVVRVKTDGGRVDAVTDTERAVKILRGRWGSRGIVVTPNSPGEVHLTVPAARREDHVTRLIGSPDYRVYDFGEPLFDTPDPAEAARWLRDNASPSAKPAGYAVLPRRPDEQAPGRMVQTRAEAVQLGLYWTVVAVPAGVVVLVWPSPPSRYVALRDDPIVRAEEIVGASDVTRTSFSLELTEAARDRLRSLPGTRDGEDLLLADGGPSPVGTARSGAVSQDGVVVSTGDGHTASDAAAQLAGGAMAGGFEIASTTPFGEVPPLVGRRPASLPPDVLRTLPAASTALHAPGGERPDIPGDAVVEVIATERVGIEWRAYAARAPWGEDLVWLLGARRTPGRDPQPVLNAASGACELDPLSPMISSCITGGGTDWVASLGRLSPDVVRVDAALDDGSVVNAAVEKDWWFLALDPVVAPRVQELRAIDDDGDVVGRLSAADAAIAGTSAPRAFEP